MVTARDDGQSSWRSDETQMLDFKADALDSIKRICAMLDKKTPSGEELSQSANELRAIKSISMFAGLREITAVAGGLERALRDLIAGKNNAGDDCYCSCREGLLLLESLLVRSR